jgi:hypothetical protein
MAKPANYNGLPGITLPKPFLIHCLHGIAFCAVKLSFCALIFPKY